jgi:PBP1b-binding outer membrane lipoprotein LpoB
MVGKMTRQKLVLIVAAAALGGCASMETPAPAQSASLQNAVYISNGDGATLKAASVDNSMMMPGESKLMRFYWFLGGR